MSKEVIIVAGANGSGKTTFARSFESQYPFKFINADEIAKKIDPDNIDRIDRVKVRAGKEFFQQIQDCMETGENFILESTLSGRSLAGMVRRLKEKGYFIKIAYIFLEKPDLCIERIEIAIGSLDNYTINDKDFFLEFIKGIKEDDSGSR